ncbi:MAG: hypothetical protein ACLFUK_02975 [Halanaerobium sp.]
MDNLKKILNDFLSDQDDRLSKRTYNDYSNVIRIAFLKQPSYLI